MDEPKDTILKVLRQGEKIYPRYTEIIKKIEANDYLDDADIADIMTIVATTINILNNNLERAKKVLNEQEELLHEYADLVNKYTMMMVAPSSPYQQ